MDRRLWVDLVTADYLAALDAGDFAAMQAVWDLALTAPDLTDALCELHRGLVEEDGRRRAVVAEWPN